MLKRPRILSTNAIESFRNMETLVRNLETFVRNLETFVRNMETLNRNKLRCLFGNKTLQKYFKPKRGNAFP
jgi:hypothetical protein